MILIILVALLLVAGLGLVWYFGNKPTDEKEEIPTALYPYMAEELLARDFHEVIAFHKNEKAQWFTTLYELSDYLDSGNILNIKGLTNVFQKIYDVEKGKDTFVTKYVHDDNGKAKRQIAHDFWIEDNELNVLEPRITFETALEKLMASNYPKPHSKQCALRKQVGPKDANPQYIFGNTEEILFVDSVTGEVSNKNPFFN